MKDTTSRSGRGLHRSGRLHPLLLPPLGSRARLHPQVTGRRSRLVATDVLTKCHRARPVHRPGSAAH